jgi:hypothetical protein
MAVDILQANHVEYRKYANGDSVYVNVRASCIIQMGY